VKNPSKELPDMSVRTSLVYCATNNMLDTRTFLSIECNKTAKAEDDADLSKSGGGMFSFMRRWGSSGLNGST
jgi:hypothetical protein